MISNAEVYLFNLFSICIYVAVAEQGKFSERIHFGIVGFWVALLGYIYYAVLEMPQEIANARGFDETVYILPFFVGVSVLLLDYVVKRWVSPRQNGRPIVIEGLRSISKSMAPNDRWLAIGFLSLSTVVNAFLISDLYY